MAMACSRTILIENGEPVWWGEHFARLRQGRRCWECNCPIRMDCWRDSRTVAGACACGAEALLGSRWHRRGYAPSVAVRSQRILSLHPAPLLPMAHYRDGIEVRWCAMQWAKQPRLAGIKHLNRLENVLARTECEQAGVSEGLVCDSSGQVVSATEPTFLYNDAGNCSRRPCGSRVSRAFAGTGCCHA
jgi:4-amino-4-deoxychorismate lyase